MAQDIIDIGPQPNDGQGDNLRTAFDKTNDNFTQIWTAGPVGSNVRIAGNVISTLQVNQDLAFSPNGVGNIRLNNNTIPGANNTWFLGSVTNQWRGLYAASVETGNITITGTLTVPGDAVIQGNLTVQGNTIQIGNIVTDTKTIQLANTAANAIQANGAGITVGANDAIATYLFNSTSNVWTTNIGISSAGNITAPYFVGNGSQLTGIVSNYGNANVVTLLAGFGSNTVSTTGNITANYFIGNGSLLTGVSSYANANAAAFGEAGWTGNIIPAANVTYSLGNSTNYWANLWVANNTIYIGGVALGMTAGNVLTVAGNAVLSNNSNTAVTTTGNISAGNVLTGGTVSATGNITGNFFIGNGSQLTGIAATYGNANVVANLAAFGSNPISTTGNITTTANISGAYVKGNGSELTNLPAPVVTQDISSNGAMSIMTYDGTIKYVNYATVEPSSGNIAGGNISTTGNVTANNFIGLLGNITNLDSLNFTVENISALVANNGVNIGAGGFNNLLVLPTEVLIQNVPLTVAGNILSTVAGGLNITANTVANGTAQIWNFGTDGNLTLPSNTFAVLYANGTQVSLGGGNTANVTFSDQVVIGTGTNDGSGGLYLAPGPDSVANSAVQYLRVRGGDNITHIHLDTGNNAYYDQYFGADSKYVKLEANGNVVINADDGASSATWTFGSAGAYGELTLPAGEGIIKALDDTIALVSLNTTTGNANSVYLGSGGGLGFNDQEIGGNWLEIFRSGTEPEIRVPVGRGNLNIQTAEGANVYNWTFDNTGNLTLPTEGYLLVQTGIIGAGASPAPFLSGFSSIATTGSTGNISASGNLLIAGYANITGNINGSSATFSGNVTGNTAGFAIGYRDIPQVSFTGNATLAATDAGKHYYSTLATANTLTIANNTSVSWAVGTAITVVNRGSGNITVAQGSGVSLYLAGNSSAANRTLTTYGMATLLNVAANVWMINGSQVT